MLIEDSADELDSNSDDDVVSHNDPGIDPDPDILVYTERNRPFATFFADLVPS
jgi:hypothetical protein